MVSNHEDIVSNSQNEIMAPRYAIGVRSFVLFLPLIIIIFSVYIIYFISIIPVSADMIPILPGPAIIDAISIFILLPLGSFFLIFLAPKIAMVYYKIYRRIFGKSKLYYLDMKVQLGKLSTGIIFKRALIPGLLIYAFSQIIVESTGLKLWTVGEGTNYLMLALFTGAFLVFPIVILLIVPLWLLYDSGVMSKTNPEKTLQKRSPETVETIFQFYINKIKGFGGIAFLINSISMVIMMIFLALSPIIILFVFFLPFLGVALIIPIQAAYEEILPMMTRKIHGATKLHKSELTLIKADKCPACYSISNK